MSDQPGALLDRVRKPEYTGDNRCVPCTIVNVGIAVVASGLVALVAVELAAVTLAVFLLAIYFRGYLVPGTPTLTERYLPDRLLAAFDKGPSTQSRDTAGAETSGEAHRRVRDTVHPERFLRDVDAIEPCDDGTTVCLTDELSNRIDRLADRYSRQPRDPAAVAPLFDAGPDEVSFEDEEHPEIRAGHRLHSWPSDAALVADVATHEALTEQTERWTEIPHEQRLTILRSLRTFHDRCPDCSGPIELSATAVESCCRSYEVVTVGCLDCGDPLLELDPTVVERESPDRPAAERPDASSLRRELLRG